MEVPIIFSIAIQIFSVNLLIEYYLIAELASKI